MSEHPDLAAAVAARTPARLFLGGPAAAYPTAAWLALRGDHAAARDAVHSRLDPSDGDMEGLVSRHRPIEVWTEVPDDERYLTRPDLGRRLRPEDRERLRQASAGADPVLLVALAAGLSAAAARRQGPAMVDALVDGAAGRGWATGPVVLVHRARVGVLNDLGPATGAEVVVLLVGERPGLRTAESLSAYLAYRPAPGHTDAERNLVSNIHDRGTPVTDAAGRVLQLVEQVRAARRSGVAIRPAGRRLLEP